jgi:hypothetical protein
MRGDEAIHSHKGALYLSIGHIKCAIKYKCVKYKCRRWAQVAQTCIERFKRAFYARVARFERSSLACLLRELLLQLRHFALECTHDTALMHCLMMHCLDALPDELS